VSNQTPIRKIHVEQVRERSTRGSAGSSGQTSGGNALFLARLDPFNQSGNQLRARDCEWSVDLLKLPGRAGLDLGLGLSYSSLIWTHADPYISFDEDNGSPSPGFYLGFPTIQGPYFDSQAGVYAYLLINSAGRRVELPQVGSSQYYEAGDSSYLQLKDDIATHGTLALVTTDGTQMTYGMVGGDWHCTLIEDRNGNKISAEYYSWGDLRRITDTLSRVINFKY